MKRLFGIPMRFVSLCMALVMLSFSLAPSAMAVSSSLGNKIAEPWVDSSMPWSPTSWGYFNTGTNVNTEAAGGACMLRSDPGNNQLDNLKRVIEALQTDWEQISNDKSRKNKAALFKEDVASRLKTGRSSARVPNAAPPLSGAPAASSQDRPSSALQDARPNRSSWPLSGVATASWIAPLNKSESFADFMSRLNSIPQLAGCDTGGKSISGIVKTMIPNPKDIFSQPAAFIVRILLFLPFILGYILYQLTSNLSLQATFTTPHSERGDTLVDTIKAQQNISKGIKNADFNCEQRSNRGTQGCIAKNLTCKKGVRIDPQVNAQLGFNCNRAAYTSNSDKSTWIIIAKGLRTLLSAVYGIIVISVALIYLFRRNSGSQYDVKIILPKVVGAVILSAIAPFIVGFLITTSNFIVQGTFSGSPTGSIPNLVSNGILQVQTAASSMAGGSEGFVSGVPAQLASAILPTVALIVIAFTMLFLLAVAIIKQLGLILLMIALPFACLSFIVPKWSGLFSMWCRGLVAVVTIPILQAFIMRVGIELSNALSKVDDSAAGIMAAVMSALILCVTFVAMCLVALKFKTYVTGNQSHGLSKRFLGAAVGSTAVAATGGALAGAKVAQATKKAGTSAAKFTGAAGAVAGEKAIYSASQTRMGQKAVAGAAAATMAGSALRAKYQEAKENASQSLQATGGKISSTGPGRVLGAAKSNVGGFIEEVKDRTERGVQKGESEDLTNESSSFERENNPKRRSEKQAKPKSPVLATLLNAYKRGDKAGQAYVESQRYKQSLIPSVSGNNPFAAPNKQYGRSKNPVVDALRKSDPQAAKYYEKQMASNGARPSSPMPPARGNATARPVKTPERASQSSAPPRSPVADGPRPVPTGQTPLPRTSNSPVSSTPKAPSSPRPQRRPEMAPSTPLGEVMDAASKNKPPVRLPQPPNISTKK